MATSSDRRFASLYESYYPDIYAYCRRRISGDSVDDVVADTFLTTWRRLDEVPSGDETLPWLYGVAYRTLSNRWRGSARKRRLDKRLRSVGAQQGQATDDIVVIRDEVRCALQAAERLRPQDLEVLRLAVWEELPHGQIGAVLGISEGTARQRLLRARQRLLVEYERGGKGRSRLRTAQRGGAW